MDLCVYQASWLTCMIGDTTHNNYLSTTMFIATDSTVADPGFLQGGFDIHERARSARENFTATPPF